MAYANNHKKINNMTHEETGKEQDEYIKICAAIKLNNYLNLPISPGIVNGKPVSKIMRDTRCTTVDVSEYLVNEDISKNEKKGCNFPMERFMIYQPPTSI